MRSAFIRCQEQYAASVPGPERRRTTIRELAEYTGLSPAAVSYALRGLQVSARFETVRVLSATLPTEPPLPVPPVLTASVAPKDQASALNAPVPSDVEQFKPSTVTTIDDRFPERPF